MSGDDEPDNAFKAGWSIVDDEPCPKCGAMWNHPDPELDFPNRPKVQGEDGAWWWKCFNPKCGFDIATGNATWYEPMTGRIDGE